MHYSIHFFFLNRDCISKTLKNKYLHKWRNGGGGGGGKIISKLQVKKCKLFPKLT